VPTAARYGVVSSSLLSPVTDWRAAPGIKRERRKRSDKMDMRKFSGEHFVKVADVKDGPIQGQIAVVKEGKYDKANIVLESGDVLSLNATNSQTLMRAYGTDSDYWIGKQIELFLGVIQYQGSDHEAVLVRPVSTPLKLADQKKPQKKPPKGDFDDENSFG
jgi:hypothetical protein